VHAGVPAQRYLRDKVAEAGHLVGAGPPTVKPGPPRPRFPMSDASTEAQLWPAATTIAAAACPPSTGWANTYCGDREAEIGLGVEVGGDVSGEVDIEAAGRDLARERDVDTGAHRCVIVVASDQPGVCGVAARLPKNPETRRSSRCGGSRPAGRPRRRASSYPANWLAEFKSNRDAALISVAAPGVGCVALLPC